MNPDPLDRVLGRLKDRVSRGDLLVHAFAERLGVLDLGTAPVGEPGGLLEPRRVAVAGLRESRGRASARPFLEGLRWLRGREYFRPHVPHVFEADPLAILAIALAVKDLADLGAVAWIQGIAREASSLESDPWRIALLAAASGERVGEPDLAVALGQAIDEAIRSAARELALLLDDVPSERAAVRLAVLTRSPAMEADAAQPVAKFHQAPDRLVKVLFLAANPTTTTRLTLDEEMRAIEERIQLSEHRDRLRVVSKWAVRPDDLQVALLSERPAVVHFSGHGTDAAGIVLHGDVTGSYKPVTGKALRHLFETLLGNIRIVVLNACHSSDQAQAIAEVVDFVIGMKDTVDDEAAKHFAASFYLGLASGESVRTAFQLGINSVMLHELPGEDVPELLVRSGASAEEILIATDRAVARA